MTLPRTVEAPGISPGLPEPPVAEAVITAPEFLAMIEAEIFAERRVFLWEGRIYERKSKPIAHALTAQAFLLLLIPRLPEGWIPWVENPLTVTEIDVPLPDLMIVRGPLARYMHPNRHPDPADSGLVVEVALTSRSKDLGVRAEKFARGLVPVYWVADCVHRQVVVHDGPEIVDGRCQYSRVRTYKVGEVVPLSLAGQVVEPIPVLELFP
jgi:Uma2 family endonuclease